MSGAELVKVFNTTLIDFLKVLRTMYPQEAMFLKARSKVDLAATVDPNLPIRVLYDEIEPYANHIETKNEAFFMEFKEGSASQIAFLTQLKQYWRTMGPDNQAIMWQWVSQLYKLAKAWHSLQF